MDESIYYPSKINYNFIKNLHTYIETDYNKLKEDIINNIKIDLEIKYIIDNIILLIENEYRS